jgi:hypothetical protein
MPPKVAAAARSGNPSARNISRPTDRNTALAGHVAAIRQLGKQTVENVIEIGRHLVECKGIVGHSHFGCWIDKEFGWAERTAQRYMSVYELAGKNDKLSEIDLPVSALYLLAAPSTPDAARDEILERAEAGEKILHAEVREKVARAKSTDTKVRKQPARKAGKPKAGKAITGAADEELEAECTVTDASGKVRAISGKEVGEARAAENFPRVITELERLREQNEKLRGENHRLENENGALESQVKDLREANAVLRSQVADAVRASAQDPASALLAALERAVKERSWIAKLKKPQRRELKRMFASVSLSLLDRDLKMRTEPTEPKPTKPKSTVTVKMTDMPAVEQTVKLKKALVLSPDEAKAVAKAINKANNDTSWKLKPDRCGGYHRVSLEADGNIDPESAAEEVDLVELAADFEIDIDEIRRNATTKVRIVSSPSSAPAVDDGLDIPASLRRGPAASVH